MEHFCITEKQNRKEPKRMFSKVTAYGCLLVSVVLLSSCQQMGAGISGSSCPITNRDAYVEIGPASGSSMALGIMGLQLWPTSAYDALQDAKRSSGADGIINITADNIVYFIPPVFPILTWHRMVLRGDAIRFERGGK